MSILLFLVVLLVLVLVHEFGHFIVAKKFGIRVDEFAFGFPPRLFAKKKGETTYAFNALPLGGYVKIYGENPDEVTTDRTRSFIAKPRPTQALVIVAGVVFNLLLAWFLISAVLMAGIPAPVGMDGYTVTSPRLMITGVNEGTPAKDAGLLEGDVLVTLSDGTTLLDITEAESATEFIAARLDVPLTITYERQGEIKETVATPSGKIVEGRGAIGVYLDMVGILKLPPHLALWEGLQKTYEYTKLTVVGIYTFIWGAVTGEGDFAQVTGPVGIVNAVGQAAGVGLTNLVLFAALISINLAVINLIPFPALDGGRLLFIAIESIVRRPIPIKIANALNLAGFALLMLLMVAVTYHDVVRLVQ